jgi:hypothetical protein
MIPNFSTMTNEEIARYNEEVKRNREIVRNLWERLDRKPTLAEMEAALNTGQA